jgi:hypothetical protein
LPVEIGDKLGLDPGTEALNEDPTLLLPMQVPRGSASLAPGSPASTVLLDSTGDEDTLRFGSVSTLTFVSVGEAQKPPVPDDIVELPTLPVTESSTAVH